MLLRNRYFHPVFTTPVCPAVHPLYGAPSTPLILSLNLRQEEVRRELSLLNPSKLRCPNNIPARLLKEGASDVAPSLTKLFQLSLHLESVFHCTNVGISQMLRTVASFH